MTGEDPLLACLAGHLAADMAIARLLLAGENADGIRGRVRASRDASAAWTELDRLTQRAPLERLRRMLDGAGVDHAAAATPDAIAALFDRAVAESPEASVAMYSLGDHARLQVATEEVVDWLRRAGLLGPDLDVLDLGCGIGRVAAGVAGQVRWVLGTEISRGMLQEAQRRCVSANNVSFVMATGQDLAALADATFDLVLAVDSFPYLVQAGVAERHMAEVRRVLRVPGRFVLLNLSYRESRTADRADAERWAQSHGLALRRSGISPFRLWDAVAYVFERT
ncbi:MAG TPA: class I SAM-dependent methyltransferase [Acetobacteraceae bacterium]|jgi:ubiquinone/menaquinone biosynthesis C-methylase UbiE